MARVPLSDAAYNPFLETGVDLAAIVYDALTLGPDNGVEVNYDTQGFIVLNNTDIAEATYTFISAQPTNLSNLGLPVPDKDFVVPIGGMLLVPFNATFRIDNKISIDCDVAASVAVVR